MFGFFTSIGSWVKTVIFVVTVLSFTSFVSYHYITITWYKDKFREMESDLKSCQESLENWNKREIYTQESIEKIKKYYENEINRLKTKKDGELKKEDILDFVTPKKGLWK